MAPGAEDLTTERHHTQERIAALTRDFDAVVESCELVATDDEHDPEGQTIAFERQQVAALLADARRHLVELDLALARVADGTYGTCAGCGRPIAPERLAARPATRTCLACTP